MKRKDISPERYKEVYRYFREFEPNKRWQNFGFALMHAAFKSDVHYLGNSNEMIGNHLADGGSVILSPNHHSNCDTPTLAGLVYEPTFSPLKGNTIIPAKSGVVRMPIFGRFFHNMQAHPTFRFDDYADQEEFDLLHEDVADELIQFNIDYINEDGNAALFSEAHRNKDNKLKVQELRRGIGHIATSVRDPNKLMLVELGFAYRHYPSFPPIPHSPVVVVSEPFKPTGMSVDEVLGETRYRMQAAVDVAFDIAA